jgi:hypothetical protein
MTTGACVAAIGFIGHDWSDDVGISTCERSRAGKNSNLRAGQSLRAYISTSSVV